MEMRQVFVEELERLMKADERVCVIDADLARASGTLKLREIFPERALDVGVAEANMASVAAGMASYGYIPFITTFAPFATRRMCDQFALSICYADTNVKVVGTDPGITAELNGGTHMAFEDMSIVRTFPNVVIFEPVDVEQLRQAMPAIVDYKGPMYIRLARKPQPDVFDSSYKFDMFKADVIKEGTDITILATGIMVAKAVEAVKILADKGVNAELINVHTLKPLDKDTILKSIKKTNKVLTVENHSIVGGLYGAIAELTAAEYPVKISRIGIEDVSGQVGKLDELADIYKLTTEEIVAKAEK